MKNNFPIDYPYNIWILHKTNRQNIYRKEYVEIDAMVLNSIGVGQTLSYFDTYSIWRTPHHKYIRFHTVD